MSSLLKTIVGYLFPRPIKSNFGKEANFLKSQNIAKRLKNLFITKVHEGKNSFTS